ncbi:TetR/AcrR family transcriptional regulator [Novosphingobium album (ex Hu et al. 2023)]|uniref:TetR/AcrR family transcriptional regulator n=1 Tax=Novosphingobium album (ex Hu et al. 2023) TaxID=2930093 RepID=A0ABT0B7G9_9SPHN|nr:TetR family transcriptional regulator [Novosphingobium album (ex Hu et al. 2023)]MCJ2181026.1 TetR/AcrR family transcriptional regulator [Novosphingobium album (ex Hu et al. 2023)]
MATTPTSRTSAETKARIVLVAQDVFSTKGYSHAGLREIAAKAEVAASLVIKYFGTKAKLFEEALVAAIQPAQHFQQDRTKLGEAIVAAVLDPQSRMQSPAMIALALGDAESREIVERIVREQIVDPMASWLGSEDARVRAINILAMTMGFSIFHRNMDQSLSESERWNSGQCFARSLQDLVDRA